MDEDERILKTEVLRDIICGLGYSTTGYRTFIWEKYSLAVIVSNSHTFLEELGAKLWYLPTFNVKQLPQKNPKEKPQYLVWFPSHVMGW